MAFVCEGFWPLIAGLSQRELRSRQGLQIDNVRFITTLDLYRRRSRAFTCYGCLPQDLEHR